MCSRPETHVHTDGCTDFIFILFFGERVGSFKQIERVIVHMEKNVDTLVSWLEINRETSAGGKVCAY